MSVDVLIRRLFVVVTILGLAGIVLWFVSYRRQGEARELVNHTRAVQDEITGLERAIQALDLGIDRVMLTGDEARVAAVDAQVAAIPAMLAHLTALTADNQPQHDRMIALDAQVERLIAMTAPAIAARRAAATPVDPQLAEREAAVVAIGTTFGEIAQEESRLFEVRRVDAVVASGRLSLIGVLALSAMILFALLMFPLIRRQLAAEHRARAELERSERFLDEVVENIPNMVFVKDATELRFERFNRAGEALLGEPRANLLGKNDHDFFPKDQADFFQAKDRETLAGGVIVDIAEEPIETPAGKRWLHTRKVPIKDAAGRAAYLLGISEDITEQKLQTEALRQANDAAEAAIGELEAFSYSVAHDLRAPLRAIDGFTQAVLEDHGGLLPPDALALLERVRSASQRMAGIIDALLALARLSRVELTRAPVDLSAKVRRITDELARTNPDRSVAITIQPGLATRGDAALLRRALENLLGNAWKFTGRRDGATIEFGRQPGPEPVYFIRDNGAGFDMAHKDKLFTPFQRLHATGEFEGTGVGLATASRVIERHGGRIWAESVVGKGATFFFVLPEG